MNPLGRNAVTTAEKVCELRRGRPRSGRLILALVAVCLLTGSCALSVQAPVTQPAAITQQLLVRSLERALQLDVKRSGTRGHR
jgi:hypothetical protein